MLLELKIKTKKANATTGAVARYRNEEYVLGPKRLDSRCTVDLYLKKIKLLLRLGLLPFLVSRTHMVARNGPPHASVGGGRG